MENIKAEGISSSISIPTGIAYDATKILYPTKLNFDWILSSTSTLPTGSQVEVGRFTLGADAADVNNSGSFVTRGYFHL